MIESRISPLGCVKNSASLRGSGAPIEPFRRRHAARTSKFGTERKQRVMRLRGRLLEEQVGAILGSLDGMHGGPIPGREYGELRLVDRRVRRHDAWLRNGDDKAAAAFAISRLLPQDLPRKIPSKQQDIVRLACHQLIGMSDGNALAGQVLSLFVYVGVGYELEEPLAEIKLVDHHRAFCGRAVAGDALPLCLLRDEQGGQRVAKRPDATGEIFIKRK